MGFCYKNRTYNVRLYNKFGKGFEKTYSIKEKAAYLIGMVYNAPSILSYLYAQGGLVLDPIFQGNSLS